MLKTKTRNCPSAWSMDGFQTRLDDPSRCISLKTSNFIIAGRMIHFEIMFWSQGADFPESY